ncbi:sacsin N-terminal ATP-binding-like domain-containing protein [Nocardia brasiliensis]|uniref:sacsin N-terminal ATP-binding-like domain-containing protein n=1 Tax=Nocardia brasiliensis TaxID=37326 RepID=UPI002453D7A3|nr:ATP-binding protein [Nocardia brasiliensis]
MNGSADPFGTAALRAGVLAAWRDSPTRLREDAATEADLVRAGYRDRLLTELAQNAADAAAKAGVPGRLRVWLDGSVLHVANTGAPLDVSGVHALTALRASGKSDAADVGRFGVGFTAVLAVSDEIELRSTTGSLLFSRAHTRDALRSDALAGTADQLAQGEPDAEALAPPALRLAWPSEAQPADGFDTEVVLAPRPEIDAAALLTAMHAEAVDLLLELPALQSITVEAAEFTSRTADLGDGLHEVRVDGPADERRIWWSYRTRRARWLLPIRNGRPVAVAPDVLRAPTRSDEELSLPALLIADIPMQPDRRRLLPGARLAELASGYADFARALPPRDRLVLVPSPAFARSEADALLREAVIGELRANPWLPVLPTNTEDPAVAFDPLPLETSTPAEDHPDIETPTESGFFDLPGKTTSEVAVPTRASAFTGLTEELAALLGDVIGPLVIPELSGRGHAEALGVLDVHRVGLARLAELSSGLERAPQWWYALYEALEQFVADPLAAEELGALAVPLADGRLVTGPRTTVLDDQLEVAIPVHWARLVHPDAAHPLLARLGARSATVEDLLREPDLRAELEDHPDDPDTVDAVLRLAAHADAAALPTWLGLLELPDIDGVLHPADELLLPDAPLHELLVADSPFHTIDPAMVEQYGAQALRAVRVGWDFSLVVESDPTGPDHDLDDEDSWWSTLAQEPRELAAVRDLDLIDDDAWPEALWQLASAPRTRRLLTDHDGYTAWWLRTHARISGTPLGLLRHPEDTEFDGLLPTFAVPGLADDAAAIRALLADPAVITLELAAALLDALADPANTPTPEVISRTHARLAAAVAADRFELTDLELPDRVRALSGAVIDPADALVLDQPWFGLALPPDRLVVGVAETAPALAALLDLPLVSGSVTAEVVSAGRRTTWSAEPLGVVLRQLLSLPPQDGELVLHDELTVRLHGAIERTTTVPWWREGTTVHANAPR